MKWTKWLHLLLIPMVAGFSEATAEETKSKAKTSVKANVKASVKATAKGSVTAATDTSKTTVTPDDDWLNTIWTQVDDTVKKEELKLQETVTVAGVRGAEAEDNLLDKLYYKGGKRYPSQDKLKKAIDTLKGSIASDPKGKEAPKLKFFVAQCYEKIGNGVEARNYYGQVIKDHAGTKFAVQARDALTALGPAQ
tara:strand:+ start:371 stop:952 length:582 start_codon:yes stop_codon:yes gene_type:complete